MKNTFVNHSLEYLIRNNACTEKQKNIFRYTLESLYSLITKTSVVLILSLFLKTFPITLTMILLYSLLRGFAFGIHATKNIYCWVVTLSVYIFVPLCIQYVTIPNTMLYIVFGISILFFILWAPADTPSRPLLNKKKRETNKVIVLILASVYIFSSFYFNNNNFSETIFFTLLIESICICPITYKLFHIPYKNYLHYKK